MKLGEIFLKLSFFNPFDSLLPSKRTAREIQQKENCNSAREIRLRRVEMCSQEERKRCMIGKLITSMRLFSQKKIHAIIPL